MAMTIKWAESEGSTSLNVFVQEGEPDKKDGLWLKRDAKWSGKLETVDTVAGLPKNPVPISNYIGSSTAGNVLYIVDGEAYVTRAAEIYKYNADADTWDLIGSMGPVMTERENGIRGVIGSRIYQSGGNAMSTANVGYYDVKTNETDYAGTFPGYTSAYYCETLGTNIYYYNAGNHKIGHYDSIAKVTYNNDAKTIALSTDIDIVGMINISGTLYAYSIDAMYKVDVDNYTYEKVCDLDVNLIYSGHIATGSIAYFFGGGSNSGTTRVCKFDTATNTLEDVSTQIGILPYYNMGHEGTNVGLGGNTIYFIYKDGWGYVNGNYKMDLPSLEFTPNTVLLLNGNTYRTNLLGPSKDVIGNIGSPFSDTYITDDNGAIIDGVSKAYGDGESWKEI